MTSSLRAQMTSLRVVVGITPQHPNALRELQNAQRMLIWFDVLMAPNTEHQKTSGLSWIVMKHALTRGTTLPIAAVTTTAEKPPVIATIIPVNRTAQIADAALIRSAESPAEAAREAKFASKTRAEVTVSARTHADPMEVQSAAVSPSAQATASEIPAVSCCPKGV